MYLAMMFDRIDRVDRCRDERHRRIYQVEEQNSVVRILEIEVIRFEQV